MHGDYCSFCNQNECIHCDDGATHIAAGGGKCLRRVARKCTGETYNDGFKCTACELGCATCGRFRANEVSDFPTCLSCLPGLTLSLDNHCISCLDEGWYTNHDNLCIKCHKSCKTCNGRLETECTSCTSGTIGNNNACNNNSTIKCPDG